MKLVLSAIVSLLAFPALAQDEGRFTTSLDVNVVLVDVTVTNRQGEQILGLGPNDFIVTENGVPQEIESVEYFTNRRLLDQPESQAPFQSIRTDEPRHFVLFFDKSEVNGMNTRSQLWRAGRQARDFVDSELAANDEVAIAAFGPRLEMYSDFTSDREQAREAIARAVKFGVGDDPGSGDGPIMSGLDSDRMMNDTGRIYDALGLLGEALTDLPGRKVLVLFTPGFGEESNFSRSTRSDDLWFEPMLQTLNEANTSVYVLSLLEAGSYSPVERNISRLATETGGDFYRNPVSFTTPLRRIENENNGYYLITYRSSKAPEEHGYQKIEVKLRNPEFRVKAREGYLY